MVALDQGAMVVLKDDRIAFESYRGLSNRSTGELIKESTRFQIASISKTFTATALLLLVDSGALTLQDPVSKWLGSSPSPTHAGSAFWEQITIHQLLTHTAGLGHWPHYPELDLEHPIDPRQEVAIFDSKPLLFPAGRGWSYSSPGYVVLAYLVEQTAGQPYRRFIEEKILAPCGLRQTFLGNASGHSSLAAGYECGEPADPFELETVGRGTGDVWSTASELAQWMSLLERPTILSSDRHQAMLTRQAPTKADPSNPVPHTHYGYGIFFGEVDGEPMLFHTGHNPGFRALAGFIPAKRIAFAYLSNEETDDLTAVRRHLTGLLE
jgi:CubicO group peptidase (beta-lactamase class C family)